QEVIVISRAIVSEMFKSSEVVSKVAIDSKAFDSSGQSLW
ncbi:31001_t:CDS:1, partial [Racocetra persica]